MTGAITGPDRRGHATTGPRLLLCGWCSGLRVGPDPKHKTATVTLPRASLTTDPTGTCMFKSQGDVYFCSCGNTFPKCCLKNPIKTVIKLRLVLAISMQHASGSYLIVVFKGLRSNQKPDGVRFCSLRREGSRLQEGGQGTRWG